MRRKRRKRGSKTIFSILSGVFLICAVAGGWGAAEKPSTVIPTREEAVMEEPPGGPASDRAFMQSHGGSASDRAFTQSSGGPTAEEASMRQSAAASEPADTQMFPPEASELIVHFVDVGQGDCTLIVCDGEAMLIDAGNNDKGTAVQLYLTKQGVENLKYVIGTHPDADHIGGLDVILYKFDCGTVIMPDKSSDTATYRDVLAAMESKGYRNTLPVVGDTYTLGSAVFTIVSPSKSYDASNNCSVAVLLAHGENSFLFTGDAEGEAESDMLETGILLDADVYKVGHHGSSSSSTEAFLNAVTPEYAVISCGEGNSYGHPHAETLNHLREMGIQVFRTDEQGTITVTSDGNSLIWNCSPSETWQSGEGAR